MDVIALTEQGRVLPLTARLSLYAADLALQHRLSFADAIVYASARLLDVPLITADDHFKDLPEVIYFSKNDPPLNFDTRTSLKRQ
ncbi:MAG: PIN domain-containing protein [Methylobacter sp.]|nr:PIN domain-containing protein [Methylobacter sp.]